MLPNNHNTIKNFKFQIYAGIIILKGLGVVRGIQKLEFLVIFFFCYYIMLFYKSSNIALLYNVLT